LSQGDSALLEASQKRKYSQITYEKTERDDLTMSSNLKDSTKIYALVDLLTDPEPKKLKSSNVSELTLSFSNLSPVGIGSKTSTTKSTNKPKESGAPKLPEKDLSLSNPTKTISSTDVVPTTSSKISAKNTTKSTPSLVETSTLKEEPKKLATKSGEVVTSKKRKEISKPEIKTITSSDPKTEATMSIPPKKVTQQKTAPKAAKKNNSRTTNNNSSACSSVTYNQTSTTAKKTIPHIPLNPTPKPALTRTVASVPSPNPSASHPHKQNDKNDAKKLENIAPELIATNSIVSRPPTSVPKRPTPMPIPSHPSTSRKPTEKKDTKKLDDRNNAEYSIDKVPSSLASRSSTSISVSKEKTARTEGAGMSDTSNKYQTKNKITESERNDKKKSKHSKSTFAGYKIPKINRNTG